MPASKAQQRAVAKYMAANYDEIKVRIPKGQKSVVQAAAEREGESLNSYTNKALLARMGIVKWPEAQGEESKR